jgi:heme exporter protein B
MLRAFITLVRWDVAMELRRPVATLNMTLFAIMLLFIGSYALSEKTHLHDEVGPIFFWMVILFAGTVGLSRAFLLERENSVMAGVLVAPLDPGYLYLAKVVATWLYVMAMEILVLGAYIVLFDFDHLENFWMLLGIMASFTLVYVAAGVVIAAMTTTLRSGELVLRILIFPIMIPSLILALMSGKGTFWFRRALSADLSPTQCAIGLLAMGAIYLVSGFLLFAKVVEE